MIFEDHGTGRRADVSFRPYQWEDATEFRSCIEDFYSDGYPYKEYLDSAFLMEKSRSGQMVILCGVTREGEIVSTSAVRFDTEFPGSGLLLLRVVKEAYRGMGIGATQERKLFRLIQDKKELCSLYADVMTHNTVSQGSLARRGFVLCGLRLMLYQAEIMVPGLSFLKGSKLSQAVMCRRENMEDAGLLHCPQEHAAIAGHIYEKLGVRCRIDIGLLLPERKKTVDSCQEEIKHHTRVWKVQAIGKDFPQVLERMVENTRHQQGATILCYLNIKDQAAVYAYEKLRENGFFFTGFKPLQSGEEYMLLAHIGDQEICTKKISLYADGSRLLAYIQKHRTSGKGGSLNENN